MAMALPNEAIVERRSYTAAEVFEKEKTRIFERVWQFAAHEHELKKSGDFRTAHIAGEPLLIVRGPDGKIRAFFNSCRHRGTMVESQESGRAERFKCPYHHWTYDLCGRLESLPRPEGYGDWFRKEDYGLIEVPRLEIVCGLVFVSLDPNAKPLPDYLGEARPYLEYICMERGEPYEVIDIYEYEIKANWKLLIENTLDGYHPPQLHERVVSDDGGRSLGRSVDLGWHGMYEVDHSWRLPGKEKGVVRHLSVFPNFLALYSVDQVQGRERMGLRVVIPLAPDRMKIRLYCFGPAGASAEKRAELARNYSGSWGPGGAVGADDAEVLERVQQGLMARHGASLLLLGRGLNGSREGPREDEHSLRAFWRGWRHWMEIGG